MTPSLYALCEGPTLRAPGEPAYVVPDGMVDLSAWARATARALRICGASSALRALRDSKLTMVRRARAGGIGATACSLRSAAARAPCAQTRRCACRLSFPGLLTRDAPDSRHPRSARAVGACV